MKQNKYNMDKFFDREETCKVLVVGDSMLDKYKFGSSNRLSPEAPVPIFIESSEDHRAGGSSNVAVNLSALGCNATLCSIVGDDIDGNNLSSIISSRGIKSSLVFSKENPTIIKTRIVSMGQQLLRIDRDTFYTENDTTLLMKMFIDQIPNYDVVIFSDYNKGTLADVEEMIRISRQLKVKSIVDPKQSDYSVYTGASIITPNLREYEHAKISLGVMNEPDNLIPKIILDKLDIEALLITKGDQGMTLHTNDSKSFHFPAVAHSVRDVTGAGDTVVATLARSLCLNIDLITAVYLSNQAASLSVLKNGTSSVELHELQKTLESD